MTSTNSVESYLKLSRRAVVLLLFAFLWLGVTCVALAFFPDTILAQWPMRAPLAFPAALIVGWFGILYFVKGQRWDGRSREAREVVNDEFRQANLLRAQRAAFVAVLVMQVPLALAALHLTVTRALIAMAGTTITFGMTVLISVFLYLDRE